MVIKVACGLLMMPGTARSPFSTSSCVITPVSGELMVVFFSVSRARTRSSLEDFARDSDDLCEDFIRKMSGQISGLIGCEAEDRIASGETPALVLDCMGGSQNRLRYRGKGILDTHIVGDVAQRRYSYLAIPDHAAHPNAAILYTLYLSSPEGQQNVVYDYYGSDLDLYPGSHAERRAKEAQARGVKFIDVNVDWWKTNQGIAEALHVSGAAVE